MCVNMPINWMKLKSVQLSRAKERSGGSEAATTSRCRRTKDKDYAGLVGCTSLAFVLYLNTLNAGFVYDDRRAILGNADVTEANRPSLLLQHDYWGTSLLDDGSHGSWRPLCVLSFRLDYQLGHGNAFVFHLTNLLLHCLATALVLLVAHTLLPPSHATRVAARVAAALFATHPIHTEAVAGLVGRADLGACICCLLSFLVYHRHMQLRPHASSLILAIVLALAALLSKETGIATLLICGLCDVLRAKQQGRQQKPSEADKHRFRSLSILGIALLAAFYCRLCLVPRPTANFSAADNPTAHESCWWTRTFTFLHLPVLNLQLLLWPQNLSFDWGMEAIPRIRTFWDWHNAFSAAFYGTLLTLTCKGMRLLLPSMNYVAYNVASIVLLLLQRLGGSSCRAWQGLICACNHQLIFGSQINIKRNSKSSTVNVNSTLLICIAFLTLPFLPACNLFFYVGFVIAERLLYLPSVGYCLLLGLGFGQLRQRYRSPSQRRLLLFCLGLILSAFSMRTVQRNHDWLNEEQLFRSAVAINPPKALGNLGSVLSSQGRYEEAKLALQAAIWQRPTMADAHYNLGWVHQQQQNYSSAVNCYRRAIQLHPQLAVAYLNLATSLLAGNSSEEAAAVLLMGARLQGRGVRDRKAHLEVRLKAYLQLASLQRSLDKRDRAVELLNEALTLPQSVAQRAELHQRLAVLHAELQQWPAAEEQQQQALKLQPTESGIFVQYGQLLARNRSRSAEAEMWFKRSLMVSPLEASVHHHYAEFLEQQLRPEEALVYRLRATSLAPHNYALQAAVADALRLLHRLDEAELWYRHAAALHPQAAHAHANLGAMLQMRGLRQQAVACYRKALQLQPGHATSRINLAKMNVNIDAKT
ncbi:protein O-mannosyl-transferase TMTC1 isoform X1 [Drosophila albomicans]|uniref:dolichyl-phosphate-mannose--protein mannosyltransferase n=1 Tax=Drosophila albomicans TaxID=7291 RepID=A0A6P8W7V8_DROAB|nr:protein O-mannosyl-transferase TMTC1 isoform X1 [Drosophila albomicans]